MTKIDTVIGIRIYSNTIDHSKNAKSTAKKTAI